MLKNLLRLNFLTFEKFDNLNKIVRYGLILIVVLPIGALITNGMMFRTIGLILGFCILGLLGLWTFNIGNGDSYDNSGD